MLVPLLLLSILALIAVHRQRSPWSAGLLVPYLVWVSAAGVLNWDTWRLNPQAHAWQPQSALNAADNPPASIPSAFIPPAPSAGDAPTAPNAAPR